MSAVPVTEQAILGALHRLPPERWPQVLAFIDSLQPTPTAPTAAGPTRRWTPTELRKLPPAQRDAILAEQAAALADDYRTDGDLTGRQS
jgi:hypothetical protein